ncbi:MAG: zinc ribbon domain-containing protein [Chloroflexota bacterium]|nr:zinc ribbon domain-containing protein [Chloroflexota bacterium]MEE2687379.1 zinc ribbon domain-containing protein [Chloroflexota bacterium]
MASEQNIQTVLAALSEVQHCEQCGTRFRFGDIDCPHCGYELDDQFRAWATILLNRLGLS